MGKVPISKKWRDHLVMKLQDRYGLAAEQAQSKADVWLRQVENQASPQPNAASGESDEKRGEPRLVSCKGSRGK